VLVKIRAKTNKQTKYKMIKGYKYRIYPNNEQQKALSQMFGNARYTYNWGLDLCIKAREAGEKKPSYFDLSNAAVKLKKEEGKDWLQNSPAQTILFALKNLDSAYKKFFKEKKGFPTFKSKHDNNQSIGFAQGGKVDFDKGIFIMPKLGAIKTVYHRTFEGNVKTCVISKVPSGKYFVSITVSNANFCEPEKKPILESTAVGIDTGIKTFAVLSDGTEVENPKHLQAAMAKLKKLQQRVSRKNKGSANRKKAVKRLATMHEKVSNQRKDFANKLSHQIATNYDTVIVEDLNIAGMLKNNKLALSIASLGLGSFYTMLNYKVVDRGGNYIKIGRFEPSSKTCSNCGNVNKDLKLSERTWTCTECQTTHDRDLNAAMNIKKMGLATQ
jgi:putative transposase